MVFIDCWRNILRPVDWLTTTDYSPLFHEVHRDTEDSIDRFSLWIFLAYFFYYSKVIGLELISTI